MADLVVTTDFSQVNNLNTALKSTDTIFVKAVDSVIRESNRFNRVSKTLAKTTEETLAVVAAAEAMVAAKVQQESLKREKTRIREAAAAEREAKRIEAANKRAADSEAKLAAEVAKNQAISAQRFTSGLNQRTGVTGASAMQSGASFSAMDQEIERLKVKYDKIYAASRLYETSLEEINRAHMLGATSIKQHEAALEQLNTEYQNFQNGTATANNRFAQGLHQNLVGMNNFGVITQQAGYQIGDFIVQVQSGTNGFVAFGQQATQMVGFLPLLAAELGIAKVAFMGLSISMAGLTLGLSIIIPLLTAVGAAWMRTSESSDKTSTSVDKQAQAYDGLIRKIEDLRLARQMEASGVQSTDEQVSLNEINKLIRERNGLQNQTLLLTSQEMLVASGGRSQLAAEYLEDQADIRQARIDEINEILRQLEYERQLETAAKNRANEVRDQYREEKKFKDLALAATELLESTMRTISTLDLSGPFKNMLGPIQAAIDKARELAANNGGMVSGPASNKINGLGNLNLPLGMVPPALGGIAPSTSQRPQARPTDIDFGYYPDQTSGSGSKREKQIRKEISLTKELTQAEKDRQNVVRSVQSSLEDGFMSMVDGTTSVKDAFKSMARDIIKELYRVLVVQRMVGNITSAFGPLTGPSTGSLGLPFGNTRASGGSIMGGTPYLVGEQGPELVIPRHSGTVVNANQTANALGGNSGAITVQNNITVTGSDAAMVRAEVAKMIPQITNATKAAVIDAKQRGGQMAAAFR